MAVIPARTQQRMPALAEDWVDRAACRGEDPAVFFDPTEKALAYCESCRVVPECWDRLQTLAGEGFTPSGVWAGRVFAPRRTK